MASEFVHTCRRLGLLRVQEINSDYVQYLINAQTHASEDNGGDPLSR